MVTCRCSTKYVQTVVGCTGGGYYPTNYIEAASMMVRGLQGLPLPHLKLGKLSPAFKETMWNNIVHHSSRYPVLREWLEKLQKNQRKHGLPEYEPCPAVFFGKGMRDLYDEVKRTRVVRTREWFPDLTPEQKKSSDEAITAYIKAYDYKTVTEHPSEQLLIEQMTWTERSAAEAFAHSAPVCLFFIQDFTDFLEGTVF
ncbi:hypothetical protein OESDEN_06169 [Oesophagostomum dentatum]|uniref:Uncharacterized protein n=1 Tax=Oesophagostomum dentatum TaxID=61180 RepID=A0A0B1T8K1_OESDE|nr:hypothetical protein OESDEN_06169 [Oesophagostomum dentatum]